MDTIDHIGYVFTILTVGAVISLFFHLVSNFIMNSRSNSFKSYSEKRITKLAMNQFIYFSAFFALAFSLFLVFIEIDKISNSYHYICRSLSVISAFLYVGLSLHLREGLKIRQLFKQCTNESQQQALLTSYKSIFKTRSYYLHTLSAGLYNSAIYSIFGEFNFIMASAVSLHMCYIYWTCLQHVQKKYLTETIIYYFLIVTVMSAMITIIFVSIIGIKYYLLILFNAQVINYLIWACALLFLMISDNAYLHYQNSVRDPLTGAFNRRYFSEKLEQLLTDTSLANEQTALIICDIDDFKQINDIYGHDVGDLAIQSVVSILQDTLRTDDFLSRIGGEEFAIVLPHTNINQAYEIANDLCQKVQNTPLSFANNQSYVQQMTTINLTGSFGVAMVKHNSRETLIKNADRAMYKSKQTGKNKVTMYQPSLAV